MGNNGYEEIKMLVSNLIRFFKTSNPYYLAAKLNIFIKETNVDPDLFKARVYFVDDKKGIMINKNLDDKSKKILIAHEIGHALLHKDFLTYHGCSCSERIEYEANLFALELLSRSMSIDISQFNQLVIQNIISNILEIKDCY